MIPQGVEIFIALAPIDLRYSFDRLAGLATNQIGYDVRSGAMFIFFGKRKDALKVLFFDGTGLCVFYKRLDRSTFRIPEAPPDALHLQIDDATLEAMLDGVLVEKKMRRTVTH